MPGLTICAPIDKPNSKCWQVFTPLLQGWPCSSINQGASIEHVPCVWGLGHGNYDITKAMITQGKSWLFTDMPYFNRWMGEHTAESCHWRLIPNALHECNVIDYPSDRARHMGINLQDWRQQGNHVLVAPSSDTITRWLIGKSTKQWLDETLLALRAHTDRPVVVRHKPRRDGKSGPMVENRSVAEDLKDCWAVITLCSLVGVEAAIAGIPVMSHSLSATAAISTARIDHIENPRMPDRQAWLNTLSYRQFTKAEMRSGLAHAVLHQLF